MDEPEVFAPRSPNPACPPTSWFARAADPEIKQELLANTERAVARACSGSPSFFVGDALFFGRTACASREEIEARKPAMKLGTSLRFLYPTGEHTHALFRQCLPRCRWQLRSNARWRDVTGEQAAQRPRDRARCARGGARRPALWRDRRGSDWNRRGSTDADRHCLSAIRALARSARRFATGPEFSPKSRPSSPPRAQRPRSRDVARLLAGDKSPIGRSTKLQAASASICLKSA